MEQLERAVRYLTKLSNAYEGIHASSAIFSIEQAKDDCISFFMHCYHIKDWLKTLHGSNKAIENYIDAHEELRICADICNGAKHCRITGELRSGSHQKIESSSLKSALWLTGSGGVEIHQCKFKVVSKTGTHDALQLAIKCMDLWKSYIQNISN